MGLGFSKDEPKPVVKEEKGGIFNIFVKKSPPPPPPAKKHEKLKEALPIVGAVVLAVAVGKYLIDKKVWTKIPGFKKKAAE